MPQITNTAQLTQTTLSTQCVETCSYVFLWVTAWWRTKYSLCTISPET